MNSDSNLQNNEVITIDCNLLKRIDNLEILVESIEKKVDDIYDIVKSIHERMNQREEVIKKGKDTMDNIHKMFGSEGKMTNIFGMFGMGPSNKDDSDSDDNERGVLAIEDTSDIDSDEDSSPKEKGNPFE